LLPEENKFKAKFSPITYLSSFATTYRYPKDAGRIPPGPEKEELRGALATLYGILDEVAVHFGVDLEGSDRVPAKTAIAPRL
jgi:hypothetical protein